MLNQQNTGNSGRPFIGASIDFNEMIGASPVRDEEALDKLHEQVMGTFASMMTNLDTMGDVVEHARKTFRDAIDDPFFWGESSTDMIRRLSSLQYLVFNGVEACNLKFLELNHNHTKAIQSLSRAIDLLESVSEEPGDECMDGIDAALTAEDYVRNTLKAISTVVIPEDIQAVVGGLAIAIGRGEDDFDPLMNAEDSQALVKNYDIEIKDIGGNVIVSGHDGSFLALSGSGEYIDEIALPGVVVAVSALKAGMLSQPVGRMDDLGSCIRAVIGRFSEAGLIHSDVGVDGLVKTVVEDKQFVFSALHNAINDHLGSEVDCGEGFNPLINPNHWQILQRIFGFEVIDEDGDFVVHLLDGPTFKFNGGNYPADIAIPAISYVVGFLDASREVIAKSEPVGEADAPQVDPDASPDEPIDLAAIERAGAVLQTTIQKSRNSGRTKNRENRKH